VKICKYCNEELVWTKEGWRHQDGSLYKQKCRGCGWIGGKDGSFKNCPNCNSNDLVDDHCVWAILKEALGNYERH